MGKDLLGVPTVELPFCTTGPVYNSKWQSLLTHWEHKELLTRCSNSETEEGRTGFGLSF